MKKFLFGCFQKTDFIFWGVSVLFVLLSFFLFDRSNIVSLAASLIGVTSLIYCAKGNPLGQVLMIVFSGVYGIISYGYAYYGEMITYLGMTAPMALISLISWIRNPYKGNRAQVKVNRLKRKEFLFAALLTLAVTVLFYFILKVFSTENLLMSTVSVATSFFAVYLTLRRSPYFALAYAANDIVLIVLWGLAAFEELSYLSVVICFLTFLLNDLYGFVSWKKMQALQNDEGERVA